MFDICNERKRFKWYSFWTLDIYFEVFVIYIECMLLYEAYDIYFYMKWWHLYEAYDIYMKRINERMTLVLIIGSVFCTIFVFFIFFFYYYKTGQLY